MDRNDITWGAIIPLIGGLPLGVERSLGKKPEFVLSYHAFGNNDQHYVNYIRKHGWDGNYILLDEADESSKVPNVTQYNDGMQLKADVICGTPPCAGLSSLSSKSSADSAHNEWMLKAANFVLESVRPQVYFFENAIRLSTLKGKPVLDKLYAIGKAHGYNFMVYTTKSMLHGNPQIRARSYGIFIRNDVRGNVLPVFNWFSKKRSYMDVINEVDGQQRDYNDFMDVPINDDVPSQNPFYRYICDNVGLSYEADYAKFYDVVPCSSINGAKGDRHKGNAVSNSIGILDTAYMQSGYNWTHIAEWMDSNGYEKTAKFCRKMQSNLNEGRGLWMHGMTIARDIIPAFVGEAPTSLAHPTEDRYLTYREGLALMDFPIDFTFADEHPSRYRNHMCQNVCVSVAKDIADEVVRFITGENTSVVDCQCMIQRNITHAIDVIDGTPIGIEQVDEMFNKSKPKSDMCNTTGLFA